MWDQRLFSSFQLLSSDNISKFNDSLQNVRKIVLVYGAAIKLMGIYQSYGESFLVLYIFFCVCRFGLHKTLNFGLYSFPSHLDFMMMKQFEQINFRFSDFS